MKNFRFNINLFFLAIEMQEKLLCILRANQRALRSSFPSVGHALVNLGQFIGQYIGQFEEPDFSPYSENQKWRNPNWRHIFQVVLEKNSPVKTISYAVVMLNLFNIIWCLHHNKLWKVKEKKIETMKIYLTWEKIKMLFRLHILTSLRTKFEPHDIYFRFDGSIFSTAASSTYPHQYTSLGRIAEGLVAISGYHSGLEVELFANGYWFEQPEFPESVDYFKRYSVATVHNTLYVIG